MELYPQFTKRSRTDWTAMVSAFNHRVLDSWEQNQPDKLMCPKHEGHMRAHEKRLIQDISALDQRRASAHSMPCAQMLPAQPPGPLEPAPAAQPAALPQQASAAQPFAMPQQAPAAQQAMATPQQHGLTPAPSLATAPSPCTTAGAPPGQHSVQVGISGGAQMRSLTEVLGQRPSTGQVPKPKPSEPLNLSAKRGGQITGKRGNQ